MNYIHAEADEQIQFLNVPSYLPGFTNTRTMTGTAKSGKKVINFKGILNTTKEDRICECCGNYMHVNNSRKATLRHLNFGETYTCVEFNRVQMRCPVCGETKMQEIKFKAPGHWITNELYQYTRDLLAVGKYTLKQVADITGLGKNTVKDIDLKRLKDLYTIDGEALIKPEKPSKFLAIDEFKLHDGYKYATHIIDLETGHILWISEGKKKQIVYDFIDHVGLEWMDNVEAVACDMNSDFQEAFEEKCPHIQPVFDRFHIVKNFNDKVISAVRKDEQRRLSEEGNTESAKLLKNTKYILMSNRSTLQEKDSLAGTVYNSGSEIFGIKQTTRKSGYEARYDTLLKENKLFFTADLVKEKLSYAYSLTDESLMAAEITEIIDICEATGNKHFKWFSNLLFNHFEGIIAHATYTNASSGKIEGINNKIKTLRRQAYGYPDDEYFFLKLFDISRITYIRNVPSHKICD